MKYPEFFLLQNTSPAFRLWLLRLGEEHNMQVFLDPPPKSFPHQKQHAFRKRTPRPSFSSSFNYYSTVEQLNHSAPQDLPKLSLCHDSTLSDIPHICRQPTSRNSYLPQRKKDLFEVCAKRPDPLSKPSLTFPYPAPGRQPSVGHRYPKFFQPFGPTAFAHPLLRRSAQS